MRGSRGLPGWELRRRAFLSVALIALTAVGAALLVVALVLAGVIAVVLAVVGAALLLAGWYALRRARR